MPHVQQATDGRFAFCWHLTGGFDLGLERTGGFETVWQCEIDPYATKVLEKHWPDVRRWRDVRTFPPEPIEDWRVDLICGGFPCQDISACNYRGQGIDGDRSGLWFEFARIIRALRPAIVVAENVPAITFRGLNRVLWDLTESGYDAEWNTLSARQFGAPHQRDRLFIVAHRHGERLETAEYFTGRALETTETEQAARLRCWPGFRKPSTALPNRLRWVPDSELCRVVDGVPDELGRYRCLGNAVVPAVAQWIGKRILEAANET